VNPPRPTLIQNAVRLLLKDGTYHYLNSAHHHDYVSYNKDGIYGATDGGLSYIHRVVSPHSEDWDLYTDSPFAEVCAKLLWGTYGIKGDQPLKWKPLAECDLDHLKAILATQRRIKGGLVEKVVKHWIDVKSHL